MLSSKKCLLFTSRQHSSSLISWSEYVLTLSCHLSDLVVELMLDYERLVISRFRPLLYKVYLFLSTENEKPERLFKRGGSETSKRHKEGRYLENKLSTSVLITSSTGGNCDSSNLTHSESWGCRGEQSWNGHYTIRQKYRCLACNKNDNFVLKPIFLAKNKATNGKPVSKLDYDNSEKIIQAEVEICYS